MLEVTDADRIKTTYYQIKYLGKLLKVALKTILNPIETLPSNLRLANETASYQAKIIEEQIAGEKAVSKI